MAETFRAPKAVQDEANLNPTAFGIQNPLDISAVIAIRTSWQGENGRAWAEKIIDNLAVRAANARALSLMASKEGDMTENSDLNEELTELLADIVSFYFRAHGAHWNVTGTDFAEYHKLFNDIYEDVYGSIDPLAENLRKLGIKAPSTLPQFIALRNLEDSSVNSSDARVLATDLLSANEEIVNGIAEAFDSAQESNQQGIANFLADRLDKHQFWKWQLTASLGQEVANPTPVEPAEDIAEEGPEQEESTYPMPIVGRSVEVLAEERKTMLATAERITMSAEVRAMDTTDGSMKIGGYAATFNSEADGLSFREVIAPGAFTRALQSADPVFLLVNHDMEGIPLASTQSGTLQLRQDKTGLYMEAELDPANPKAQELASALKRGDMNKMSFAFTVQPDGQTREGGLRTIEEIDRLFEVSVVTIPAYSSTTVGMRSAEEENLEVAKMKIALKHKQRSLRKGKA